MKDEDKSKELLLQELKELRGRIAELEQQSSGADDADPQVDKARKLESVGLLAGGIAHEFNNILTAVIGNIILAKMYAKPGSEVSDILNEAERASRRAEDLARQLLTFSRGGMLFKKVLSVRDLIADLAGTFPEVPDINCEFELPEDLWPVEADENQLRQAITPLIINGIQAMPEGGTVKISAENAVLHETSPLALKQGDYVKVSVEDRGTGIDEAHMEKIFDPFFTTREKGRGLGLTSAFSIVRDHGGYITVESRPGAGTTFHVYLPASEGEVPAPAERERVYFSGQRRVLVMDDEEIVRNVVERMLNQCGCEAVLAKDGDEMIEFYEKAIGSFKPFDAVIIDLIVARGMGGKEAIKKLLATDPGAKAIVSSGYSDDLIMADYKKFGFRGVLAKPYELSELNRVLHEVILGKEE